MMEPSTAAVEVSMDNLAAYHAEVQRLMEENAALKVALAGHEYHNCASLEAQNTELDAKLAELERK